MDKIICGRHPVKEAIRNNVKISKIYVSGNDDATARISSLAGERGIAVCRADRNFVEKLCEGSLSQGVAAVAEPYAYSSVSEILKYCCKINESPFLLVLEDVCDPHNLGAVVRTAEAVGVHGIIIPKNRSASVNQTVYKSSAGAVTYVRIARVTNISRTLDYLKKNNVWVYGADASAESLSCYNQDLSGAVAVVLGSEGKGLSRLVKKNCDALVHIPMFGRISSLNVSVSAGILCYEILRQRGSLGAQVPDFNLRGIADD